MIRDYEKEVKETFEKMGAMSNTYLIRKYNINHRQAHLLMKPLAIGCWLVKKENGIIYKLMKESPL